VEHLHWAVLRQRAKTRLMVRRNTRWMDQAPTVRARTGVRHTLGRFGQLDILVNNAGIGGLDPLTQVPLERIEEMIAVNIRATIIATQEALQSLPAGGRIINIGSVNADRMPSVQYRV